MLKGGGIGAAYGAAQGMQDNETAGEVALSSGIGAGIGASIPALAGLLSVGKQAIRPSLGRAQDAYKSQLENTFFGGKESTAKRAYGAGENNPVDFLMQKAKNGDPITIGTTKNSLMGKSVHDTEEATNYLLDEVDRLKGMTRDAFRASPERISIEEVRKMELNNVRNNPQFNREGNVEEMVGKVNSIFDGLKKSPAYKNGLLTLEQADDIKSGQWSAGAKAFVQSGKTSAENEAHVQVGRAFQKSIEGKIPEGTALSELNKYIGQHLETIDQLKRLHNTTARGKVSNHMARALGAIAGAGHGPVGSIGGAQIAERGAEVLSEFNANNPFVMNRLLQESKKDPEVVTKFSKFLAEQLSHPTIQRNAEGTIENLATKIPGKVSGFGVTDLSNKSARPDLAGTVKLPKSVDISAHAIPQEKLDMITAGIKKLGGDDAAVSETLAHLKGSPSDADAILREVENAIRDNEEHLTARVPDKRTMVPTDLSTKKPVSPTKVDVSAHAIPAELKFRAQNAMAHLGMSAEDIQKEMNIISGGEVSEIKQLVKQLEEFAAADLRDVAPMTTELPGRVGAKSTNPIERKVSGSFNKTKVPITQ